MLYMFALKIGLCFIDWLKYVELLIHHASNQAVISCTEAGQKQQSKTCICVLPFNMPYLKGLTNL